jgi:hypothetical protein
MFAGLRLCALASDLCGIYFPSRNKSMDIERRNVNLNVYAFHVKTKPTDRSYSGRVNARFISACICHALCLNPELASGVGREKVLRLPCLRSFAGA